MTCTTDLSVHVLGTVPFNLVAESKSLSFVIELVASEVTTANVINVSPCFIKSADRQFEL